MRYYNKVVFFPSEVGLAHISRSLAIAEQIRNEGYEVSFVIPRRKANMLRTPVPLVYLNSGWKDDLSYLLGHRNKTKLLQMVHRERAILELMKPDLVVADTRQTAVAAAAELGIRTVCIANTTGLPYGPRLPNFGVPGIVFRLIAPLFETLAWHLQMRSVRMLHRHAQKNVYIIPEPVGYLVPRRTSPLFRHVGAVAWNGFKRFSPPWLTSIRPDGKTVYLTLGGSGFAVRFMVRLIRLLLKNGYTVIVSGNLTLPADLGKNRRLFTAPQIDGDAVCRRVDAVICHGGYHTMMQAAGAGRPIVAVPQNPNQMLHALRFQELGVGICVMKKSFRSLSCLLGERWDYYRDVDDMDESQALAALEHVMRNQERFKRALHIFNLKRPNGPDGAARAAAIIKRQLKYVRNDKKPHP